MANPTFQGPKLKLWPERNDCFGTFVGPARLVFCLDPLKLVAYRFFTFSMGPIRGTKPKTVEKGKTAFLRHKLKFWPEKNDRFGTFVGPELLVWCLDPLKLVA